MSRSEHFLESPSGTREEIMCATYRALCAHGYADLTIERIGEQFEKSKSLIYHHYDGKDELLLDFLEFSLHRFEEMMPLDDDNDADQRLNAILDHVFETPLPEERLDFTRAMVELRSQAAHDERYRQQFTRHDRFFRDRFATIIEQGIEDGVFDAVDPEAVATMLLTTINGAMAERATTGDDVAATLREQVGAYIDGTLIADG